VIFEYICQSKHMMKYLYKGKSSFFLKHSAYAEQQTNKQPHWLWRSSNNWGEPPQDIFLGRKHPGISWWLFLHEEICPGHCPSKENPNIHTDGFWPAVLLAQPAQLMTTTLTV